MAQITIDYVTMRIMDRTIENVIEQYLDLSVEDFISYKPWGKKDLKYKKAVRFGHIIIYYDGSSNMGVCVEMSGEGCREYCSYKNNPAALLQLFYCLGPNDNVTRLDIAFDDFDGALSLAVIMSKVGKMEIRTRLKNMRSISDLRNDDALTIYFGHPTSKYEVRIYNKAAETHYAGHWIRAEEILRNDIANCFVHQYMDAFDSGESAGDMQDLFAKKAAQVFLEKFAFIEMTDSNVSRCDVCIWWTDFLGTNTRLRLKLPMPNRTTDIEDSISWLKKTVAPKLAATVLIVGPGFLIEMLQTGIKACSKQSSAYAQLRAICKLHGRTPYQELCDTTSIECLQYLLNEIERYLETITKGGDDNAEADR